MEGIKIFEYDYDYLQILISEYESAMETARFEIKRNAPNDVIKDEIKHFQITASDLNEHIWPKHGSKEAAISNRSGKDAISWFTCDINRACRVIYLAMIAGGTLNAIAKWIRRVAKSNLKGGAIEKHTFYGPLYKDEGCMLLRTDQIVQCTSLAITLGVEVTSKKIKLFLVTSFPYIRD